MPAGHPVSRTLLAAALTLTLPPLPSPPRNFYWCYAAGGVGAYYSCQTGLVFNQALSVCDWPANTVCPTAGPAPPSPPPKSPPPSPKPSPRPPPPAPVKRPPPPSPVITASPPPPAPLSSPPPAIVPSPPPPAVTPSSPPPPAVTPSSPPPPAVNPGPQPGCLGDALCFCAQKGEGVTGMFADEEAGCKSFYCEWRDGAWVVHPGCLAGAPGWYMQPRRHAHAPSQVVVAVARLPRMAVPPATHQFPSPLWSPTCRVCGAQRGLLQVLPARPALQQQSPGLRLARQRGMHHGSFAAVTAVAAASASGQPRSSLPPAPAGPAQPAWACLLVRRVLRIMERPLEINRSDAPPGHAAALRQHGEGWLVWTCLCHALPCRLLTVAHSTPR